MAAKYLFRRGTTAQRLAIIPDQGEPFWDVTSKLFYVGDGVTVGGVMAGPSVIAEGVVTLTAGQDHYQVTGLALGFTPTKGRADVMKGASGGYNLSAEADFSTFSTDGATFHFSGPIPSDGNTYKLFYTLKP